MAWRARSLVKDGTLNLRRYSSLATPSRAGRRDAARSGPAFAATRRTRRGDDDQAIVATQGTARPDHFQSGGACLAMAQGHSRQGPGLRTQGHRGERSALCGHSGCLDPSHRRTTTSWGACCWSATTRRSPSSPTTFEQPGQPHAHLRDCRVRVRCQDMEWHRAARPGENRFRLTEERISCSRHGALHRGHRVLAACVLPSRLVPRIGDLLPWRRYHEASSCATGFSWPFSP